MPLELEVLWFAPAIMHRNTPAAAATTGVAQQASVPSPSGPQQASTAAQPHHFLTPTTAASAPVNGSRTTSAPQRQSEGHKEASATQGAAGAVTGDQKLLAEVAAARKAANAGRGTINVTAGTRDEAAGKRKTVPAATPGRAGTAVDSKFAGFDV
jgi:hypothetical protein